MRETLPEETLISVFVWLFFKYYFFFFAIEVKLNFKMPKHIP